MLPPKRRYPYVGWLASLGEAQRTAETLIVSLSGGSTPEATLRLTDDHGIGTHLNGPLIRGSQIRFEGIPVVFTQDPFMLTFDVSTSPKTHHAPIPGIALDHP